MPDEVGRVCTRSGHEVIFYREVLGERVKDEVVAATALANQAILVAFDHDMDQMPKRYGKRYGGSPIDGNWFPKLSLVRFSCDEVAASKRLGFAMSLVEHEWEICSQKAARRMWVEIAKHWLRTHR